MESNINIYRKFFESLGSLPTIYNKKEIIFGYEDTLSDVIVALCNADKEFAQLFVQFLFSPDINKKERRFFDTDEPLKFYREYPYNPNRPQIRADIYFKYNNKGYCIENKVYIDEKYKHEQDKQDEYEHYYLYKKMGDDYVALIANYDENTLNKSKFIHKKTWKEFITVLKEKYNDTPVTLYSDIISYISKIIENNKAT